jgi:hypothetical protein
VYRHVYHRPEDRPGKRRRLLTVSGMLIAALAVVLAVTAAPVQASTGEARASVVALSAIDEAAALASCPANRVCIFVDKDYQRRIGVPFPPAGGQSNLHAYSCNGCISSKHPTSNNTGGDQMTSFINRTNTPFCGYKNVNFKLPIVQMNAGQAVRVVSGAVNDEVSSIRAC